MVIGTAVQAPGPQVAPIGLGNLTPRAAAAGAGNTSMASRAESRASPGSMLPGGMSRRHSTGRRCVYHGLSGKEDGMSAQPRVAGHGQASRTDRLRRRH